MNKGTDKFFLGVVGGIVLVVLLCVCCIVGVVMSPFGFLMKNGAQDTAKSFLKADPVVQTQIGKIESFGFFPQGSVNINNGSGRAELHYSLKGDKGEGKAVVTLAKEPDKPWVVVAATLEAGGKTTVLKGDAPMTAPSIPESAPKETPPRKDQGGAGNV